MPTDAKSPVLGASGTSLMMTEFLKQLDEKRIAIIVVYRREQHRAFVVKL
jgi:hypothetical protein